MSSESSEKPLAFDPEIERTLHRRKRKNRKKKIVTLEGKSMADNNEGGDERVALAPKRLPEQEELSIQDYLHPAFMPWHHTGYVPPMDVYEIPPATVKMFQSMPFTGAYDEDSYAHMSHFLKLCATARYRNVDPNISKLILFPCTLDKMALYWYDQLPLEQKSNWERFSQLFMKKYFPTAKMLRLRNEIRQFVQGSQEDINEAWGRFNDCLFRCPHHQFEDHTLIEIFYIGCRPDTRTLMDVAANGSLFASRASEAKALIERLCTSAAMYPTEKLGGRRFPVDAVGTSETRNDPMMKEMEALQAQVKALEAQLIATTPAKGLQQPQQQQPLLVMPAMMANIPEMCFSCGGTDHNSSNCQMVPQFCAPHMPGPPMMEEVQYVGIRNNQYPYGGLRQTHPGFSYGNQSGASQSPQHVVHPQGVETQTPPQPFHQRPQHQQYQHNYPRPRYQQQQAFMPQPVPQQSSSQQMMQYPQLPTPQQNQQQQDQRGQSRYVKQNHPDCKEEIQNLEERLARMMAIQETMLKAQFDLATQTAASFKSVGTQIGQLAQTLTQSQQAAMQQKITIPNKRGEKLVGVLHETGSEKLVVLCHGFQSTKEFSIMANLASALENEGISAFRFDFSGNGESEGSFEFGNYLAETEDLRSVVEYFSGAKRPTVVVVGHSKGGNVVLLYGSRYHDIPAVVNISGRYDLHRGLEQRLGENFMEKLQKDKYLDVKNKNGDIDFKVTLESLLERLNTNMHEACLSIDKSCKVLTVHGSADEVIPVEDAHEISKIIPNHRLQIVEGSNHSYTTHQDQLVAAVLPFIKECVQQWEGSSK